ncbi:MULTISPECIES: hypothetical protein [Streptomyces]|uniref:AraC family transcriptional regulator n=1 Tax=Streptomyces luteosporeus TaxID=173856 RepID=A0ABN3U591_9ACTN
MSASRTAWLARASIVPAATLDLWRLGCTAPLLPGREWDVVRVDFALAVAAVRQLKGAGRHIGPYLMSGAERAVWWLLPLGTGYRFAGEGGVTVHPGDWALLSPPPTKYVGNRVWVLPEETPPALTSPGELLGAVRGALGSSHSPVGAGRLA